MYEPFFSHMDDYASLTKTNPEQGVAEYLEKYYYGPKDWTEYLELLGLGEMLDATYRGRSIQND
jgi:glutaconate CoA-transferase subunit A